MKQKEYFAKLNTAYALGIKYVKMFKDEHRDDVDIEEGLTDSEFRKMVTDYLLGPGYYIPEETSSEQNNAIILRSIMDMYKGANGY